MTRNLQRRLQKLESQVPRQPTEQEKNVDSLHKFLACAVGYYLGDPTPEGSVIEAYRRALGYPNSHEFRKALHTNDPDFQERVRLAKTKLLEKFGVSFGDEREKIIEAFNRMEAGFSEHFKWCCR